MAIKDWKEYSENEWHKPFDKYSFVKLWKTALPYFEMKRRGHEGTYIVEARLGGWETKKDEVKKYFKLKSEALKFAKDYMKKH